MKKKTIKKILLTLLVMFSIVLTTAPAFAVDEIETGTTNKIEEIVETTNPENAGKTDNQVTITNPVIGGDSEVTTIPAFFERIEQKLSELVTGGKSILKPIVILCFFVSAILAVIGAISKKGTVMTGIIGCIVCAIAWSVIDNAELIIQSISHWLGS